MSRIAKLCGGALASASLMLGACTTLHVNTDVNPNYSVANCHTYTFAREHVANADQPAAFGNPLNADRLRMAIEANLAAKGVARADGASADCVIGYALGTRQVFNDYYGGWGPGWGWGYGWGRRGFAGGYWDDGPWVSNETRIAVDVFDARSHKAIWHGAVSQSVSDMTGPNAEAKINAATAAIFAQMPIGAGPASAAASTPPVSPPAQIIMYPKNGQSDQQQATDRAQCQQWAAQNGGAATSPEYQRAMRACIEGRGYSVK